MFDGGVLGCRHYHAPMLFLLYTRIWCGLHGFMRWLDQDYVILEGSWYCAVSMVRLPCVLSPHANTGEGSTWKYTIYHWFTGTAFRTSAHFLCST